MIRQSTFLFSCTALVLTIPGLRAQAQGEIEFNRDVRPILAANCFECHGFDAKTRKADLRLDTPEGAYADHTGSTAVKPGDLTQSELWNRVTSGDADVVMPPPESKKSLTAADKDILRRWIEQGAQYQKHWAFELPRTSGVPEVKNPEWVRTPVDAFILSKLEQHMLVPQREADREVLIRRVAFTLTGLPPTIADVDEYLHDTASDAYEKMVDRYLASPHFGEEQARQWLDVARYADTHGLHLDNEREMWAYRDWVVKAFNQNLPFDEFSTWQIAGDLLPNPTQDQLTATGFSRCNVTTGEGGAIADEWLFRYAVDRTSTTMQTWMGLTAGCAVCHDHKYDPLTQRDFYSMYSFFYSTSDPAMDGNVNNTNPFVKLPTAEQKAALAAAQQKADSAKKALESSLAAAEYFDPANLAAESAADMISVNDIIIDDTFPLGTRTRNTSRNETTWRLDPEFGAKSGRRVIELAYGSRYDLNIDFTLIPVIAPNDGKLEFRLRIDSFSPPTAFAVQYNDGETHRIVWGDKSTLGFDSAHAELGPIPAGGEWIDVSIPLETIGTKVGARLTSMVLIENGGKVWFDDLRIVGTTDRARDPLSSFQRWWEMSKGSNPTGISGELHKLLVAGPEDSVTAEQRAALLRFWQQNIQRISESPASQQRTAAALAQQEVEDINGTIHGTMVFNDLQTPRDAFVMQRGQYDKPGEKVEPRVPTAFPPLHTAEGQPLPADQRANRLDLARWFLSADNPLTSRVTVNRVWQQMFGLGLVKTSDDFGTRGDLPSHPELLDWLAVHFRESGWNMKQLYRLLITSATFRQDSATSHELYQLDPENRLLAHGPRLRLDGEQLRDNVLAVSGLLNSAMGGRGVMPYQPPDIWEPVGYENSNTRFYMQDHGPDLYRRSLYCFIKRTAPPPFMTNFDGPNREQFCARRERSNTPLQALQLMNDIQHFEAARALAERVLAEGGTDTESRLEFLYRTVLSRKPSAEEIRIVSEALATQLSLFAAEEGAATKAINVGESKPGNVAADLATAAWTMIANLVLNLDETVVRN
ncbi:MAG: PSD1 domain-containing protein [Planctomycetaceae bacterium]|nr:PSD1 domain-containing protein [Planctomycetaceae bacterium]